MATDIVAEQAVGFAPPLEAGDRLSRVEFERRYAHLPSERKAELIEGVVYMPPPVSNEGHGDPHALLIGWLVHYACYTEGIRVSDNSTIRLDWDNEPQPDAMLRVLPEYGGQSRNEDGYVALAPELLGEVSASTASYDLHDKKEAYRRNGVREYVVWRVQDRAIDWFVLREGRYDRLAADEDGILRSEVFPGLWLDATAMVAGDMRRVLEVLQQGLASAEHLGFAQELAKRKAH